MSCRLPPPGSRLTAFVASAPPPVRTGGGAGEAGPAGARILLTGSPGIGKTTLIRAVVERLREAGLSLSGFYTEEERDAGGSERSGFRVVTLDGRTGPLATTRAAEGPRVGRYTVLLREFEAAALPRPAMEPRAGVDLFVLDEFGKMESLSPPFVAAARRLLAVPAPLLATVALKAGSLCADVCGLPGADLVEVTRANRDRLVEDVTRRCLAAVGRR